MAAPPNPGTRPGQQETIRGDDVTVPETRVIALTILSHPNVSRIGEVAFLMPPGSDQQQRLGRLEPPFRPAQTGAGAPLETPFVSRSPVAIHALASGDVGLSAASEADLALDGEPVTGSRAVRADQLDSGVVMTLANAVALLLHTRSAKGLADGDTLGLLGQSEAIERVRSSIRQVSDLDIPVLLTGETGVGKELVAHAIHERSTRRDGPYECVNLTTVPASLAASLLFGYKKSAFTGASADHKGYFTRADRGTLFLDEIGDTPPEIQPLLLRALETGEVPVVGSEKTSTVDVRIVAATNVDLQDAVKARTFRLDLRERIAGFEIQIPPLRKRRDDIGRLLVHFLREELARTGEPWRLDDPPAGSRPWLRASVVARLACYDWPGNVRELRNLARQIAVCNRGASQFEPGPLLARLQSADRGAAARPLLDTGGPEKRRPSEISEDDLVQVLRDHRFNVSAAAAALNVSRTTLYTLMDRSSALRKADDLGEQEIRQSLARHGGDLRTAVAELEVSEKGLKDRMTALGMERSGRRSFD
jgi:two-component system, NtrC family, nitrogen regulation response regulator GlnG